MKCERCNVHISGKNKECPLCKNKTVDDGINDIAVFPVIKLKTKREVFIVNLITLILFSGTAICVIINLAFSTRVFWSLFVVAGSACLYVSLKLALRARRHIPKAILWEVLLVAVLAVGWDFATGFHAWSISYLIPILFTTAIVMIRAVSRILKLSPYDYIFYLIINGILGIIPLIFIMTNMLTSVIPSVICICISIISLAIHFTFDRKELIEEMKRRTHIG